MSSYWVDMYSAGPCTRWLSWVGSLWFLGSGVRRRWYE